MQNFIKRWFFSLKMHLICLRIFSLQLVRPLPVGASSNPDRKLLSNSFNSTSYRTIWFFPACDEDWFNCFGEECLEPLPPPLIIYLWSPPLMAFGGTDFFSKKRSREFFKSSTGRERLFEASSLDDLRLTSCFVLEFDIIKEICSARLKIS